MTVAVAAPIGVTALPHVSGGSETGLGAPVVILGCLLFATLGLCGLVQNVRRLLTWPAAIGTVVGHEPATGNGRALTTVVAFQTLDGRTVQGGDGIGTPRGRYSVGKQVRVRYDARNPSRIMIGYLGTLIYGGLFVWCLGFAVLLILL